MKKALFIALLLSAAVYGSSVISFSSGTSSSGGGTWGSITGTLSSQTDLSNSLAAKIDDPGTVTDNGVVTWDGTGGATVQSQSEFTIDDNGTITHTPTGSPATVETLNLDSTTTFSTVKYIAASASGGVGNKTIDWISILPPNSHTGSYMGRRTDISGGSGQSGLFVGHYMNIITGHGSKSLGVYDSGAAGVYGLLIDASASSNTAGGAHGILSRADYSNYVIGGSFAGIYPVGSSPQSYGIRAYATGENSAQTVGGFFRIYTANSAGIETVNPGLSAGLIASNGDTTSSSLVVLDNTSTVVQVKDGGNLVAGKGLVTTPTTTDLTGDDQSVTVTNVSHMRFTSDSSTATDRTIILGDGGDDGQHLCLEWAEDTATGAGELPDNTANNVRLSAAWTPAQYGTLCLRWNSSDSNWLEVSRSAN